MFNTFIKRYYKIFFRYLSVFVIASAALLIAEGCSQPKKKTYLIGYINPNPEEKEGAQGFLDNMPKFGYIEGVNVTYIKFEGKNIGDIENAVKKMVAKKADLIFTMTTPATKKAKQFTEGTGIPVIFIMYNAISSGIVKSFTHPGGNLTGIQLSGSTLKALEWLLKMSPRAKHIFVPISFDTGAARHSLEDLKAASAKLGIKLTISEVNNIEDLRTSLSSMPDNIDAIFMLHSWLTGNNINIIMEKAKGHKIPVISAGHVDYENGVILSYGPRNDNTGLQAARLANSVLNGSSPANLPVEMADFILGINLKTARETGITIPDSILQQADVVLR